MAFFLWLLVKTLKVLSQDSDKILDVENDTIDTKFDKIVLYSMFPHLNNRVETIKKLVNNNLKPNGKLLIAHSDSREFLNNLHSNTDERVREDRLIDVNKQMELFENANLKVTLKGLSSLLSLNNSSLT